MQFQDDTYYIERTNSGDSGAFSHLVDKYKRMTYTLALKLLKNPEDAEEIAQDAFVKAFQSLKEFKHQSKFSTWLFRIVYNNSISKLRKKQLEFISIDDEKYHNFDVGQTDDALKLLSDNEQKKIIRAAIDRLPDDESALITLYYLNESTIEEISEITALTESNVKVKLFRARKKLWEMLKYIFKDQIVTTNEK